MASETSQFGIETDSITLQRYVLQEQRKHADASGELTALLTNMLVAIKAIASATQKAGLAKLYGIWDLSRKIYLKIRKHCQKIAMKVQIFDKSV